MENVIVVVPSLSFFTIKYLLLSFHVFIKVFIIFFIDLSPSLLLFGGSAGPPLPLWVVLRSPLLPLTLPSSSSFLGWWCPSFGCLLNLGGAAFLPHSLGWWCLYSLWCDGAFLPSSPFFWVDVLSASLLVGGAPFSPSTPPPLGWFCFLLSFFGVVVLSPSLLLCVSGCVGMCVGMRVCGCTM